LHLINLDALDKSFRVWWHDSLVNEGSPFYLPARGVWSGRMG